MKNAKKWTRRADARPEELAKSALELFSVRGIHATRVADVAHHAGVTVGTVYRYYRDKDALIEAALGLAVQPALRGTPDRPGGTLPALAEAVRRWGAFFRDAGARSVRVALSDPGRDTRPTRSVIGTATQELTGLIAHGIEKKELRADLSPEAVARALVGALLLAPALGADPSGADADIEAVSAIVTRGLRADGPSWRQGQ